MTLNLYNDQTLIKKKKYKYSFSMLVCLKSHIKFKEHLSDFFLIKINNNISILLKKKSSIHIKVKDNKLFFFCKNLTELNEFTKKLQPFSSYISFL